MLANTPIGPDSGYLSDMFFLNVSAVSFAVICCCRLTAEVLLQPQIVGYMPMTTLPAQCRQAQDGIGSQFTAFQVILADCSDPYPVCISDECVPVYRSCLALNRYCPARLHLCY